MRIKKLLTGILTVMMACPAMAEVNVDIAADANNPGCTNSVLKTYTGPTDLEADYTANTINLNFYSDENTVYSTGTCTYDGGIELPSEDPTRTGYTFDGWQVRRAAAPSQPQQTTFDLSTLAEYVSEDSETFASKSINPGRYCQGKDNGNWYGSGMGGSCSDSRFNRLNNGEWDAIFSYGTVKGLSKCEYLSGEEVCEEDPETGEEDCREEADYACYCQATGFDAEKDGTYLNITSSSWIFVTDIDGDPTACSEYCAMYCGEGVGDDSAFRATLYGISQ